MGGEIVGFTGTRYGMTKKQFSALRNLVEGLNVKVLHHGDCVGSDTDAHKLCEYLNIKTYIHPPKNPKLRAFNKGTKIFEPKEYNERNKDIACICNILIATPKDMETRRGGTWNTIKYATEIDKKIYIISPEGDLKIRRKNGKSTQF